MELQILVKELSDFHDCNILQKYIEYPEHIVNRLETYSPGIFLQTNTVYLCRHIPDIPSSTACFNFIACTALPNISDNQALQAMKTSGMKLNYLLIESDEQFDRLQHFLQTLFDDDQRLTDALQPVLESLMKDRGLQQMSDIATEIFGNPFWVIDMNFNYLSKPEGNTTDTNIIKGMQLGYVLDNTVQYLRSRHIRSKIKRLNAAITFPAANSEKNIMMSEIKIKNITVAYCIGFDENHPFSTYDFRLMNKISEIFSVELQKNVYFKNNKGVTFSYLLTDLLESKMNNVKNIQNRLDILGYVSKKYYYIIYVELHDVVFREISLSSITEQIKYLLRDCIYCTFRKGVVFLLTADYDFTPGSGTYKSLVQYLTDSSFYGSISEQFTNISEVPKYYQQTQTALRIGRKINPDHYLYCYPDYILCHLIDSVKEVIPYDSLCHQALKKLFTYDMTYKADLVDTLDCYINCGLNIARTAEKMNIHGNTIRYRISKIKEITECSLENSDDVLELMLALKICHYQKSL